MTHCNSVGDGRRGTYTAPELPDSRVPALWDQRSMKEQRALIGTFTGRVYLVGPGGYELKLSPGSVQHDLVESSAGHLMLRCSCFSTPLKSHEEVTSFIVGDHFSAPSKQTSGRSPFATATSTDAAAERMIEFDRIANHAHDELDLLLESTRFKRQD